ncbi:MAG: hypothetical protein Q9161_007057 [Pseudevernia consocians]
MASKFLRMIYSFFYYQPTEVKEAHFCRTINSVFGDWATSAGEDLPPPYTDSSKSKTHFQDEKKHPPPPFPAHRLQVCPHETLSFEGLQKTANSLAIRNTDDAIDALTLSCPEHHSQSDPTVQKAQHVCVSAPSLLRGFGTYISERSKNAPHSPTVILCFHWDFGFLDGVRAQVETAAELQQFLGADGIWLCPHKQISDSDIVNAMYSFVKRPSGREVITGCDRCDTEIKICTRMEGGDETCRVTTKRYLGSMDKADDPQWLAQCGVVDLRLDEGK